MPAIVRPQSRQPPQPPSRQGCQDCLLLQRWTPLNHHVTFIDPQQIFVRHLDHHVAWHGASEATDDKSVAMLRFRLATQICFDVMQELARKTLLGSADMRLWVVQQDPVVVAAPGTPVSPSSPSKLLYNLSSALDKADCSARLGNHFIGVFFFLTCCWRKSVIQGSLKV